MKKQPKSNLRKSFRTLRQVRCNTRNPAETIPQVDLAQPCGFPRLIRQPAEPATGLYPWSSAGCGSPNRRQPTNQPADNLVRRLSYNNVGVSKEHEPQPVCDLRDAIASTLQTENPNDQPSILNAWITIAEYATLDGSRFLITRSGGSRGSDHITTPWQRRGMLHEVLDTGLVDDEFDIVFDSDADDELEEDA